MFFLYFIKKPYYVFALKNAAKIKRKQLNQIIKMHFFLDTQIQL